MKKIAALDLGDQWIGIALSDASQLLARPHTTIPQKELCSFLSTLFSQEEIETLVVGYPQTLRGTESEQTKKIVKQKEELALLFPHVQWILWDERLSSKQAQTMGKKGDKLHIHAKAAAVILEGYLTHLRFKKEMSCL